MPKGEVEPARSIFPKDHEPKPGSVIIYAGTSSKRKLFLQYAFPQLMVMEKSGGSEPDIENVVEIAEGKARFVIHRNPEIRALIANKENLIIATDLRTNPLQRYSLDSVSRTHSRGKPYGEHDVRKTFKRITRAAEYSSQPPFYRVDSGTFILRKGAPQATRDSLSVVLDPDKMRHFGTVKGFEDYKQAFTDFYHASQIYGDPDAVPKLTQIAGGLSLGVLLYQNAVLEIDGIPKGDPNFRQIVKRGLYTVLMSFSPDLLRRIRPDIDAAIDNYPALETATSLAMGEIPLSPNQVQEGVIVPARRPRRTT